MGGRRKDVRVLPGKESRGPGAYNPDPQTVKTKAKNYSVGRERKGFAPDIYGTTPGPDNYNPKMFAGKNQAASWGMGSGKRPPLQQVLPTPGPGSYNPPKAK